MIKKTTLLFIALVASFASFAQIVGSLSICVGGTTTLGDSATGGGTWSSSNPAVASISAGSTALIAIVNGVSAGTATISYVFSTGMHTQVVTVNPTPTSITGGGVTICASSVLTLSSSPAGGAWSVSGPATIVASTGVLTAGTTSGVATVYYTIGSCSASTTVTVSAPSTDSISGASAVCVGSTTSLFSSASGGTWSSSAPAIATVSSGIVTGVAIGTVFITHTATGSCGTSFATHIMTVTTTTSAGTISGPSSVSISGTGSLSSTVPGGVWSSSDPSVATISPAGIVTGVAAGTATISYAVSGCGPTVYATYVITVTTPNGISGQVHYTGWGTVKVWLIKYDPSTMILSAVDSTSTYGLDSAYYEFLGLGTDSFRVKAALDSGTFMGFAPTYHTSSFYWSSANVIHHTAGTWDAHKDINLITGTSTSGTGFIGGSVLTGANKGTADGAPAVDLSVYLVNAVTDAVVKYTTTDASGNYSFSGLPLGTYYVFPEALNYVTIPYAGISLTSSSTSMSTAKFRQRTVSKIIQPVTAGINDISTSKTSLVAFPNPTSGKLNISWDAATSETARLVITDVTGREVLKQDFSMSKGAGAEVVDLSSLTNGMYFISVKSANTMYISKIEVRH